MYTTVISLCIFPKNWKRVNLLGLLLSTNIFLLILENRAYDFWSWYEAISPIIEQGSESNVSPVLLWVDGFISGSRDCIIVEVILIISSLTSNWVSDLDRGKYCEHNKRNNSLRDILRHNSDKKVSNSSSVSCLESVLNLTMLKTERSADMIRDRTILLCSVNCTL